MAKKKNNKRSTVSVKSTNAAKRVLSFNIPSYIGIAFFLIVNIIIGALLFDGYVELMGDDADYLIDPLRFIQNGSYPTAHDATLYLLTLSIPTLFFGINIFIVKVLSFLWSLVTLFFTYKLFDGLVSKRVLYAILLFQATNFAILYYSSSVMSESFFMMVQIIFLAFVIKYYDALLENVNLGFTSGLLYIKNIYPIVLSTFCISLAKSISLMAPMAIIGFLLIHKRWKQTFWFVMLFVTIRVLYQVVVSWIFGVGKSHGRLSEVLLKNAYNPAEGTENVAGLIQRFWTNLDYHMSFDFLRIIGFRDNMSSSATLPLATIFLSLLFIFCLWHSFKKNGRMFFVGLYIGAMILGTFFALQTHWKQDRMIIVLIPLILLFLFTTLYDLISDKMLSIKLPFTIVIFFISALSMRHLPKLISNNIPRLEKFASGDIYGGYTTDWQNYLKASKWAADNLPKGSLLLCRKPNSSVIYSGGNLATYGAFKSTSDTGVEVLNKLKEDGVSHILLANLRLNPNQAVEGQVIGTVHSYVRAIQGQFPEKIKVLQQLGQEEPAYVLEIVY